MARSISDAVVFFNYTFKTKLSVFFLLTVDITLTPPPPFGQKFAIKKGGGNIVSDRRPSSESNKNPTKRYFFLLFS